MKRAGTRDFFFNRITFAIADGRGRVIAFGARALDPEAKPKYINTGETGSLLTRAAISTISPTARPAALKAGTIILAEGYMDVIALVRAGFTHAVAPLGTALTEDQLALMWRVAPEPILAFDGDEAGLRAGMRAAHLALPHLKAGHSLRFAFLPPGEDPDTLIAREGPGAMKKLLDAAEPLGRVLWRAETEDKDFSTPERRAGLEKALDEIVRRIADPAIADYYRRDFRERVFEAFKRRPQTGQGVGRRFGPGRGRGAGQGYGRPGSGLAGVQETVSPAVRNSLLARSGRTGALRVKEVELAALLLEAPELALTQTETLAALPFSDPQLDRLRRELLNLAASGSRLEKQGLEDHLVRSGMAELVERLGARRAVARFVQADETPERARGGDADGDDVEARWLRAVADLRELAEFGPERARAFERYKAEATEESWRDAHRLLGSHTLPND